MPLFAFFTNVIFTLAVTNPRQFIISLAVLKSDENELHGLEDVFSKFIDLLEVEHSQYENITCLKDEMK